MILGFVPLRKPIYSEEVINIFVVPVLLTVFWPKEERFFTLILVSSRVVLILVISRTEVCRIGVDFLFSFTKDWLLNGICQMKDRSYNCIVP